MEVYAIESDILNQAHCFYASAASTNCLTKGYHVQTAELVHRVCQTFCISFSYRISYRNGVGVIALAFHFHLVRNDSINHNIASNGWNGIDVE